MNADGGIIEIQGTAEGAAFSFDELAELVRLAQKGIVTLAAEQNRALAAV